MHLLRESTTYLENVIYRSFRDEVIRLKNNEGRVVIPDFNITTSISGKKSDIKFNDVRVESHNVRSDVLSSVR